MRSMSRRIRRMVYQAPDYRPSVWWRKTGRAFDRQIPEVFWNMDHVFAVSDGGGSCGLDNLRTLCTCCHSKVTKDQAGLRARRRAEKSGQLELFSPVDFQGRVVGRT